MKVLIFIGTRPEAIKLAILHKLLLAHENFEPIVCLSGQHTNLVDEVLELFGITPDYCCLIPDRNQSMAITTSEILISFQEIVDIVEPGLIICQGDTLTSYCGSLIGYYNKVKVAHVEAGLRTYDKYSPFPEELFRRFNDIIADFHFAPSLSSVDNLLREGIDSTSIHQTGNTGIDALLNVKGMLENNQLNISETLTSLVDGIRLSKRKLILLTLHRRENQNQVIRKLVNFLNDKVAGQIADIIFTIHPNPQIKKALTAIHFSSGFHVIEPLPYYEFVWLMMRADLIMSDSGGIQEEAPYLGKPVIVLRSETERKETISSNQNHLYHFSTLKDDIISLLNSPLVEKVKPYGNGKASEKIVEIISKSLI